MSNLPDDWIEPENVQYCEYCEGLRDLDHFFESGNCKKELQDIQENEINPYKDKK